MSLLFKFMKASGCVIIYTGYPDISTLSLRYYKKTCLKSFTQVFLAREKELSTGLFLSLCSLVLHHSVLKSSLIWICYSWLQGVNRFQDAQNRCGKNIQCRKGFSVLDKSKQSGIIINSSLNGCKILISNDPVQSNVSHGPLSLQLVFTIA